MFTRKDFSEYVSELRHIEEKMAQHYSGLVDEVEDDELRLRFTSLMQCEKRHAQALDALIEIGSRGAALTMPQLKWTVARKAGGLVLLLLLWMASILAYSHFTQSRIIRQSRDVNRVQIPLADWLYVFEKDHLKYSFAVDRILFLHNISVDTPALQEDARKEKSLSVPENALQEAYVLSAQTNIDMPERRREYSAIARSIGRLQELQRVFSAECAQAMRITGSKEKVPAELFRKIKDDSAVLEQRTLELIAEARRFSSESMRIVNQERIDYIRNSLILIVGGIGVGSLLAWLVISGLRRTFHQMAMHAGQITETIINDKIPDTKLVVHSTDEASVLAYLWNVMIAALSDNLRRRQKLEQEIEMTAVTDRLTGVMNRRECEDVLNAEVNRSDRYGVPLSLIRIDIDHFMAVNETYGPELGDTLIAGIAKIMQDLIRECDRLCRYGGEEFVILATNTNLAGAAVLAEKVRVTIEEAKTLPAGGVTVSIGVAQWQKGKTMRDFIRMTDDALNLAKKNGRNQVQIAAKHEDASQPDKLL